MSAIQLTAKLMDVRDSMRRLHGDRYPDRVALCRKIIDGRMEATSEDSLTAAIRIAKAEESEWAKLLFLAAAVEMSEGGAS